MTTIPDDLPGADLIEAGLADLCAGEITPSALLVAIGAPRLRALGIDVPSPLPEAPEHALYLLLASRGEDAHSAFNAYRRRLVSFQRALERRRFAPSW
ncbi:MAG: hypothetical protein KC621_09575 [Myxococcales bacterium]|nr:hypothetical protein [Myxococcales bacterium]